MAVARYRRVSPLIWDDEWFAKQSDLTRSIWFLLLTGPQVLPIPGLQLGGPASMAEALRRGFETVSKPFQNLIDTGRIYYDPDHRIIRLPNAPKRNLPDNPNQILGWFDTWRSLPESPLKYDHIESLKQAISCVETERPEAFWGAWENSFGTVSKPFPNSFGTVSKHRVGSRELELELEFEWLAGTVWATAPQPTTAIASAPKRKPGRPRREETTLPDGWAPTAQHQALATELGVDMAREAAKFVDHHTAKGSKFKIWGSAFNTWLRNASEWQRAPNGGLFGRRTAEDTSKPQCAAHKPYSPEAPKTLATPDEFRRELERAKQLLAGGDDAT